MFRVARNIFLFGCTKANFRDVSDDRSEHRRGRRVRRSPRRLVCSGSTKGSRENRRSGTRFRPRRMTRTRAHTERADRHKRKLTGRRRRRRLRTLLDIQRACNVWFPNWTRRKLRIQIRTERGTTGTYRRGIMYERITSGAQLDRKYFE